MIKKIKIGLVALGLLIGLGAAGVFYLAHSINPTQLTSLIASLVKSETGRDFSIAGPIELRFFPAIGVVAQDVSLSNASWASEPKMLQMQKIELQIKLLPLLMKQVEINRINLSGVELYLQAGQNNRVNWDLSTPSDKGQVHSSASPANSAASGIGVITGIEHFKLVDANIHYQNSRGSKSQYSIKNFSADKDGGKTAIELKASDGALQFGLQGKMTSLREIASQWNSAPLKIDTDFEITLDGKSLELVGDVDKKSGKQAQWNMKLKSKSFDLAPLAGGAAVASGANKGMGSDAQVSVSQKTKSPYFFSDTTLPLDQLPVAQGTIQIDIGKLGLPHLASLENVKGKIVLNGEQIDLSDLSFDWGSGHVKSSILLSQIHSTSPLVRIQGEGNGFTLEQLISAGNPNSKISGGDTRVAFSIVSAGSSLHQIASRATGRAQITVGPAHIAKNFLNAGGDFFVSLLDAINPMRKQFDQSVVECAVAYLPFQNGVVNIADSIGFKTDRLDITLSGTLNLNNEAINLDIYPKEKSGLTTGVNLGGLVKLQGTLEHPGLGVNKVGVLNSAVSVGLGFLTGGASIVAENAKSIATKSDPCKTAFHPWDEITKQ
ncbi:AsmA family protein [Polynucleobacter paneuropaeus]|uniref:AsmA family protein n=1 Tax=Polynucleobacter paneuropaeus TaxID=2527775 RepID=UPI001BFCD835|nr:AsmA family protein [Polynucleobacter paneuropaeus]MBT8631738.1 AsmA family protein [Polynucleobacter paneuropaeus]